MSVTAYHRQLRPQTIDELDQKAARDFFAAILESGKFSQAYLFTGPKGTGKTTSARLLAKLVNCQQNQDLIKSGKKLKPPCNQCSSCESISRGSSQAVVEMDAASNRKIEDIRELRERISLVSADGDFTIYIVDEVHMLTTQAFNALLKTLEEPPAHVIFCLCTTELHKLPDTIVSRCQLVSFSQSKVEEIQNSLKRAAKKLDLSIEADAVELLAEKAGGSFRDGLNLLQSLAQHQKITAEVVAQELGESLPITAGSIIKFCQSGDYAAALEVISQADQKSIEMKALGQELTEQLLDQIKQEMRSSGKVLATEKHLVELIGQSFARYAYAPIETLPLELAILELAASDSGTVTPKKKAKTRVVEAKATESEAKPATRVEPKSKPKVKTKLEAVDKQASVQPEKPKLPKADLEMIQVRSVWDKFLQQTSQINHGLTTMLSVAQLHDCQGNTVEIEVAYEFHKLQLEQERHRQVLEECLSRLLSSQVRIKVSVNPDNISNTGLKAHDNISPVSSPATDPLVSAVEDAFGL